MGAFPESGWRPNLLTVCGYVAAFPILLAALFLGLELGAPIVDALPPALGAALLYAGLPLVWGVASYTGLSRVMRAPRPAANRAPAHAIRGSPLYLFLIGSVALTARGWETADAGLWLQVPINVRGLRARRDPGRRTFRVAGTLGPMDAPARA